MSVTERPHDSTLRFHGLPPDEGGPADLVLEICGSHIRSSSAWVEARPARKITGDEGECIVCHADTRCWLVIWADDEGTHEAEFRTNVSWERVR